MVALPVLATSLEQQQLLLPGHRLPRLPDELRLLLLLLPLRVQHEVRHVYWLLQVLRANCCKKAECYKNCWFLCCSGYCCSTSCYTSDCCGNCCYSCCGSY